MLPDLKPVDEIRFENLHRRQPAGRAGRRWKPSPASRSTSRPLDADMRRLYGTGDFEHVNYRILEEPGQRVLAVDAVEKTWGPDYLRFGLGLSSDFSGDAYFNLLARYRRTWLNSLGAEWRTDVQAGIDNSLRVEFYQPLSAARHVLRRAAPGHRRATGPTSTAGRHRVADYNVSSRRLRWTWAYSSSSFGEFRARPARAVRRQPRLDTGPPHLEPGTHLHAGSDPAPAAVRPARQRAIPPRRLVRPGSACTIHGGTRRRRRYTKWEVDGTGPIRSARTPSSCRLQLRRHIGSNPLPAYDQFQWGGFLSSRAMRRANWSAPRCNSTS